MSSSSGQNNNTIAEYRTDLKLVDYKFYVASCGPIIYRHADVRELHRATHKPYQIVNNGSFGNAIHSLFRYSSAASNYLILLNFLMSFWKKLSSTKVDLQLVTAPSIRVFVIQIKRSLVLL